jgi:hypothetical protein
MKLSPLLCVVLICFLMMSQFCCFFCNASTETARVYLDPAVISADSLTVGDAFEIDVQIADVVDLWSWGFGLSWDPDVLEAVESPVEGSFLKQNGDTIFMFEPLDNTPGCISAMSANLYSYGGVSGSGLLVTVTFKVVSLGSTTIDIFDLSLTENLHGITFANGTVGAPIDASFVGATFNSDGAPSSSAYGPVAKFIPENNQYFSKGDLVTLDASSSKSGYDTLPSGVTCPITSYLWDVDFGDDGDVDLSLSGASNSFVATSVGAVCITLTVTAPDVSSPSDQDYFETDSEKHVIYVTEQSSGASVDVYTDRGGEFSNVHSDAYGPQEIVTVYANVTYNNVAVAGNHVTFDVKDSAGSTVSYRTVQTDKDGVAIIDFRLPWPCSNPEESFGNWNIVATVDVSEDVVTDTCEFLFGYLIDVENIEFADLVNNQLVSGVSEQNLTLTVDLVSIRDVSLDCILSVSVFDDCGVPVSFAKSQVTIQSHDTFSVTLAVSIPPSALVGQATLYIDVLTNFPSLDGIPFCPEKSATFNIVV